MLRGEDLPGNLRENIMIALAELVSPREITGQYLSTVASGFMPGPLFFLTLRIRRVST